jgi:uncharacterized membrane protein
MNYMNTASKLLIVATIGVLVYIITFYFMSSSVNTKPRPAQNQNLILINAVSVLTSVIAMLISSMIIFRKGYSKVRQSKNRKRDEFSIMKKALTKDEITILEKIRQAPNGITQDSLRFRLNWSKAKVSTMLTNLDRMGLVQRERLGKTYTVFYKPNKKR